MEDLNTELNTYLEEASISKEIEDYSGTKKIATDIRKSYLPSREDPNKRSMPKDYNPQGDLFLGRPAGAPLKPSFTETNYNVADAYARTNLGEYIPKYDSYKVGRDNAEYAAQTQSTSDKWKNGLTKFAGQVGTGIIGGTVGIVNGVIEGVKQGSFRATYDNQFNDYLDNINEKWDYQLPNYYSKEEQQAGFIDSLGSANFWAKDVLGGAAFTVSAIGSELIWDWATGGAAASTSAARLGAKLERFAAREGKFAKALESMSKAKSLTVEPVVKTYMNAKLPTKLATAFGKAGEFANVARFTYTSAGFESGVEARHYIREQEAMFEQNFEAKNGRPATEEDKQAFQTDLTKAANSLYGFNMAVVGSSNLATIGRIFDFKNPLTAGNKWANSKLFGVGVQNIEGKVAAQIATKGQKVGQYAWSLARSPLIEGVWEEGMQSVGSNTAKHWIESTYDPKYLKNTLDISEAFNQGLSDTYGTKEGMKEVGIGMLIGLLTGSGINLAQGRGFNAEFKGAQQEAKNIETFYNGMYSPQKLAQTLAYSGRLQLANQNADESSVKGDFTGAELSRQSAIIAQVAQAHNLEYLDEVTKQTKVGIQNIGNDVLMKEYGVDEQGAEELKQKMAQEYEQTAQIYKKNRDYTEYMLNNKLSKQEQEELGKTTADQVKDAVAYELTLGEKVHGFSQDLLTSIKMEIGRNFSGQEIELNQALTIENILLKAGNETRKKAEEHENKARRLEAKRVKLENQYKEIENTLFNLVDPEARKRFLTKADNLRNKITQIEQEKESLTQQYKILLDTANLENPFGNQVDDLFVSSTTLEQREQKLADIQGLVGQYKNIDPAKATKLDKMMKEYGKSIYAFKRYADLARQLSDPKLGLRGKRNIITELRSDKTPSEVTVEFLKGILEGAEQRTADLGSAEERLAEMFAETDEVKSVLDEIESEEEVIEPEDDNSIKPPTEEKKEEARQKEIDEIERDVQYRKQQELEGTQPTTQPRTALDRGVEKVKQLAQEYRESLNLKDRQHPIVPKLFSKVSKMISDAYEATEHKPRKRDVARAYKALVKETVAQYDFIISKGLKVIRHEGKGEPYKDSKEMLEDLAKGQLKFLPNDEAFGQDPSKYKDNIGLKPSGRKLDDGYELTNSEVFRVVHDYFGHGILGNEFGKIGEENATLQHLDLYSSEAAPAVIFQTRGQNSWVNFSGVNDKANELRDKARELRRQGNNEEADKLVEQANELFQFAEPKIAVFPTKLNFKRYETARRLSEQSDIDNGPNPGDNELSISLERHTNRVRSTRGVSKTEVQRTESIRGYDVDIIAEYELDNRIDQGIKAAFPEFKGVQKIYEITNGDVYRSMMTEALKDQKFKASVTVHSAEDFSKMRMFISEDGSVGVTLNDEGFLGGGFSDPTIKRPNNIAQMLILGIKEGATTAEAFDTILPNYYAKFGLKAVSRTAFNDEYRPTIENGALADWDYEIYQDFNEGRPDVVFMIYDGGSRDTIEDRIGLFDLYKNYEKANTKSFDKDSYDEAEKEMKLQAVKRLDYEQQKEQERTSKINQTYEQERLTRINEVNKKYDRAEAKRVSSTSEDIQNYVKELIKNSPYLLEYYGQEVAPTEPTQDEVNEFEELAQMAMADPKISNKTISFRNPYNKKRPGKLSMTEKQVKRLQELNEKLANWRLLEVYGNETGLSVAGMLMQDIATKQTVEQKPQGTTDVSDNELQNLVDRNPAKTDDGADIRNGEVLQTYENVYVSDTAKGIEISHLTLSGLLSRIPGGFTINYEEVQTQKNKQELIIDTKDNISLPQAQALSKPGAKYTVRFGDGTTAVIRIQKGGRLQFKSRDDFNNALKKADLDVKDVKLTNKGGYSPMQDLRTNTRLVTDYQDADSYSPSQLYDMLPGEPVLFRVDMTNPWNIEKWGEYQKGLEDLAKGVKNAKSVEQLDRELADSIKIYVTDFNGIKMNDLKANYDIQDNPQFLQVRQQALAAAKELMETGRKEMELPLQSQISTVLLGDPNIQFDPTTGKIKFFPLVPQRVETYGYMEKGKLVLKNGVKPANVRKDYVKRLEGKAGKVPVIVFRQGKYLVAFPVALVRTQANIGDEFFDRILQNKDNKDLSAYAIELNQLLLDNGISPSKHNLYFLDKNNQTLFDQDGRSTQNLIAAIDELNKIKNEAKPEDWLAPEHNLAQLETEVTVPVDMNDVILNSPKPVIDLSPNGLQQVDTNKLTDAKANDIVSKFLNKETLTQSEYDELDNPKVTELLKAAIKTDPSLREFIEKAVGKLGNC